MKILLSLMASLFVLLISIPTKPCLIVCMVRWAIIIRVNRVSHWPSFLTPRVLVDRFIMIVVVLAAGMGSRYGGLKQMDSV